LQWTIVPPAIYISIAGNVLLPLARGPLGQLEWELAQFGIGLPSWPAVTALLIVRIVV
jgi:hypothetical protein